MSILDDGKQNVRENDYLQMCNFLQQLYLKEKQTTDKCYIKIEYVPDIIDIIIKDIGKLPLHNIIVTYPHTLYDEEDTVNIIEDAVYNNVYDHLSIECYDEILHKFGGRDLAIQKMSERIIMFDDFMEQVFNKSCEHFQKKIMSYYIIDKMIVEFDHILDNSLIEDAIDIKHFSRLCDELIY